MIRQRVVNGQSIASERQSTAEEEAMEAVDTASGPPT